MLWMVKTLFVFGNAAWYSVRSSSGISAVCQSLQWITSGCKPMKPIAARTALQKNAKRSPSSGSP